MCFDTYYAISPELVKLYERDVWEVSFNWFDVINCMSDEEQETFLSLTYEEQSDLVDKYTHSIEKGLTAGIMNEWTAVMATAILFSNLFEDNIIRSKEE